MENEQLDSKNRNTFRDITAVAQSLSPESVVLVQR